MNIWMIEETREIAQTLQSVVSGWALTSMPAFCFYTRKRRCYSRWNDNTPFWLVDQEQNSIWFVWVSPAPCISPLRELSLTSDRSAVFFSFSVCDIAPPTLRTTALMGIIKILLYTARSSGSGSSSRASGEVRVWRPVWAGWQVDVNRGKQGSRLLSRVVFRNKLLILRKCPVYSSTIFFSIPLFPSLSLTLSFSLFLSSCVSVSPLLSLSLSHGKQNISPVWINNQDPLLLCINNSQASFIIVSELHLLLKYLTAVLPTCPKFGRRTMKPTQIKRLTPLKVEIFLLLSFSLFLYLLCVPSPLSLDNSEWGSEHYSRSAPPPPFISQLAQ